jgi:transcription elongation factor Elf1
LKIVKIYSMMSKVLHFKICFHPTSTINQIVTNSTFTCLLVAHLVVCSSTIKQYAIMLVLFSSFHFTSLLKFPLQLVDLHYMYGVILGVDCSHSLLAKYIFYAPNIVTTMSNMIKFIHSKWLGVFFCPFCSLQKVGMSYLTKKL